MAQRRAFCSEDSRAGAEPVAATASRVDHWILVEYRGRWAHDAVDGSGLSDEVKRHLREVAAARPHTKLLFVRRPGRVATDGPVVVWGSSPERGGALFRTELRGYDDLLELDPVRPGEPLGHPLLLVCTHGKHDRCCARYGRPLFEALGELADEGWVWQSSHVGGDRFAGNLVVLPEGIYFGRVDPADAAAVLEEYVAGRVRLDVYRGRCAYGFAEQAAERTVRDATGLRGVDDLELVRHEGPLVSFRAGGRVYDVELEPAPGELTYLTCSAEELRRPRRYAARILRESAA